MDKFVNPNEWEHRMELINNSISSGINGSIYDKLHHDISEITYVYVSDGYRFIYTDFANCVQNQPFMICLNSCFSRSNDIRLKEGWFMTYDEANNDVYVATQQLYQLVPLEAHDNKDGSITLKIDILLLNNFTCGHVKRDGVSCSKCTHDTSVSVTTYTIHIVNTLNYEGMNR